MALKNVNLSKSTCNKWNTVRVSSETRKLIDKLTTSANKKSSGRKVKLDEIVQLGLGLIQQNHIESLKKNSLTNEDRKEQLRQIYIKKNGQISKDAFTGFMMSVDFGLFLNEHKSEVEVA